MAKSFLKILSNEEFSKKHIIFYLFLIGIVSLSIRLYYFPTGVPLTFDSLEYFFYAMDISVIGKLPENYSPINNGWPIFLSLIFSLFSFEQSISYMELQRYTSVIISVLTIIPVYFLCKKFVSNKISIIGAGIIAFEPRLIQNSLLGIADSLYIFLVAITLVLFLDNNKKKIYFSFVIIGIGTIVRAEGIFLFLGISIVYLIRFRKNKSDLVKFIPIVIIFLLILLPIQLYRINIYETDGIFIRVIDTAYHKIQPAEITGSSTGSIAIQNIIENFPKYFLWDLIPIFIFFMPIGIYYVFKKMNISKLTIIISSICMIFPTIHAYSIPLQETRYFYFLYPLFCVVSVLALPVIFNRFKKQNLILILLMIGILVSSSIFLQFKMWDTQHESEAYKVAEFIVENTKGVNQYYPEYTYIESAEIPKLTQELQSYFFLEREDKISIRSSTLDRINTIPTKNLNSLNEFIEYGQKLGLTHIIIDDKDRNNFLDQSIFDAEKFPFLTKVFDSRDKQFNYVVQIYEIDFEQYFKMKNNND